MVVGDRYALRNNGDGDKLETVESEEWCHWNQGGRLDTKEGRERQKKQGRTGKGGDEKYKMR